MDEERAYKLLLIRLIIAAILIVTSIILFIIGLSMS